MKRLKRCATSSTLCSLFMGGLLACGRPETSSVKEEWNAANRPELLSSGYERQLRRLPLQGQAGAGTWTGDYWPSFKAGIAQRWQVNEEPVAYDLPSESDLQKIDLRLLSPAEKYDLIAGDENFSLTRAERMRTQALRAIPGTTEYQAGFHIPEWEGLCHGWAPATLLFKEPKPVTLRSPKGYQIPFGSADVKALLTLMVHDGQGSRIQILGERCETDGNLDSDACRDTNAGSFHLVLANELGRKAQSFVMDVTRSSQVWNQGVVAFTAQLAQTKEQSSPGAAPGTRYEVEVKADVDYIVEFASDWQAQGSQGITRKTTYRYRLELNDAGEIIGGTWLSQERPDFLWRQSKPTLSQRLRYLKEIYLASTGESLEFDTEVPPSPEPSQPKDECPASNPWCF